LVPGTRMTRRRQSPQLAVIVVVGIPSLFFLIYGCLGCRTFWVPAAGLRRPRLITLDSTGTLMRVKQPDGKIYRDAMVANAPMLDTLIPTADELTHSFSSAYKSLVTSYPCFGAGTPGGCRHFWRKIVYTTMRQAGMPLELLEGKVFDTAFNMLYDDIFTGDRAWELLDSTVPALRALRRWCDSNGCQLGVVSNMDDRLPTVLRALGVESSFDFVLTSYECGAEKPSPEIFAEARRLGGISRTAPAIHVGDSLDKDVQGAQSSGFAALYVNPTQAGLDLLDFHADFTHRRPSAYRAPHLGYLLELPQLRSAEK